MTLITSPIESRFVIAASESYQKVLDHGARSPQKTKVLHGWVQDELRLQLGDDYTYVGQTPTSSIEATVSGYYYDKKVNVLVSRDGQELGVISVKFVISNYGQNSVNYFEQQIGETANLRSKNIVYGNLFCVTDPIPYKMSGGGVSRLERLRDQDVQRYVKLRADREHAHAPDEMAIGIVDLDTDKDAITGMTDISGMDLSESSLTALQNNLSISNFFRQMARRIELQYESL